MNLGLSLRSKPKVMLPQGGSDACRWHVMYALRASDVWLRHVVEETLRVSISIVMDKTEGFAP